MLGFLVGVGVVLLLLKGKGGSDEPIVVVNVPPKFPKVPDPGQPETPKGPGVFDIPDAPDEPDEPPGEIDDWTDPYPTPGRFYQVKKGNYPLQVAKQALFSAGYQAATEVGGLDHDEALAFASEVGNDGTRQYQYLDLMQCSGWNDVAYETFGFGKQAHESPNGRALRFLRQHPDNRKRLEQGKGPLRNMAIGTQADKGKGNRIGVDPALRVAYEFLWLPAINLDALWSSGGSTVTVDGLAWDDGSSQQLPPPFVTDREIQDASGLTVTEFGCGAGKLGWG